MKSVLEALEHQERKMGNFVVISAPPGLTFPAGQINRKQPLALTNLRKKDANCSIGTVHHWV